MTSLNKEWVRGISSGRGYVHVVEFTGAGNVHVKTSGGGGLCPPCKNMGWGCYFHTKVIRGGGGGQMVNCNPQQK